MNRYIFVLLLLSSFIIQAESHNDYEEACCIKTKEIGFVVQLIFGMFFGAGYLVIGKYSYALAQFLLFWLGYLSVLIPLRIMERYKVNFDRVNNFKNYYHFVWAYICFFVWIYSLVTFFNI